MTTPTENQPATPVLSTPIVYVVDDDPAVLAAMRALLLVHDYQCELFDSGVMFLERVAPRTIGCVIADFRMPIVNGEDIHRHLQTENSTLSVIISTGAVDAEVVDRIQAIGSARVLQKPIPLPQLLAHVAAACEESRAKFVATTPGVSDS
ncbi:MAG: response regulator [Planctomycetales bacterium]|nr:response regulator [Planctomycetales bacterium]